ncbi:MAG: molybdopterin molybdotransferase MoeA, partial [Clostridiales bacterium]
DVILEGDRLRFAADFVFDPQEETVDPAGTIVMGGALLVPAHTRLTPTLMASLAMGGISWVPVIRKLTVAFIPTGSELIPPGSQPQRGQNIETNGMMLSGLLTQWGAEVICHPIVGDDAAQLEQALDKALSCADMVLINGGSSRGEEDFNSHLLERRSSFFRHGVKAVPGRPIAFSIVDDKPVLNVPGPVAAAYLAAHWCLSALTCHWYGLPDLQYPIVTAKLEKPLRKRPGFELMARVALKRTPDGFMATQISWGDDGIPGLLLHTDGLLNVPAEMSTIPAGEIVKVELLRSPELIRNAGE